MSTIRAAILHDALDLRVEQIPSPPLLPGHVAISPKFCGLCGSDLHFYFEQVMADTLKAAHPLTGACSPTRLGHEFAGLITELDAGYTGELRIGDPVAVMPTITDGTCWACTRGFTNVCSQLGFVGIHGSTGGLGDRAVVPEQSVFKLPESIGLDVGALIEPLSVGWHAITLLGPELQSSTSVLILGGGAVGCAVLLGLLARGVTRIVVSEPSSSKRDFALQLGASSACDPSAVSDQVLQLLKDTGRAFDSVFDCAGIPGKTLETAVQSVRPQGTIVNLAIQPAASVPLLAMMMKETQLKCSLAFTAKDFTEVIAAVAEGRMDPRRMITKKVKLEDVVQEGLEALHDRDCKECKVLVDIAM